MSLPSLRQVRFAVLFFIVFFLISAIGQYLFVRAQTESIVVSALRNSGYSLNKAVSYNNGVDLKQYNRAWFSLDEFAVVLNDGTVLDSSFFRGTVPPGLLPPVECPVVSDQLFSAPTTVSYTSGARQSERWTLFGRRLDEGFWIFGFSEYDTSVENPEQRLLVNAAMVGPTLESALNMNVDDFDLDISWVLIDDRGTLLQASGRIPLKTDPLQIGRMSAESPRRVLGNTPYYVLYWPVTDPQGAQVGVGILPGEERQVASALRNLVYFNAAVAVASVVIFLLLATLYYRTHENEKEGIRDAFRHYFSPQILDAILREPSLLRLGGQRREVTVLFSDIRSFTTIVEKLAPQQLTQLMQEYFSEMTDAVLATDGIIDKFIGDALMAFWGAPIEQPDQADRAVRAAIDMTVRLQQLQERWTSNGLPRLDIGIGIYLGLATIGNFGSAKRFDYTVIGDTVNAAARLESLNKDFRTQIIISESTKAQLTLSPNTRDLGEVTVKGKEKPVRVFEVIAQQSLP